MSYIRWLAQDKVVRITVVVILLILLICGYGFYRAKTSPRGCWPCIERRNEK